MFSDNSRKTVGVIAAMQSEIEALKAEIAQPQRLTVSGIEFVYGEMYGVNVVMAISGIGKVFAGMCAQTMILKFSPDCIINIGVAGSLAEDLKIADAAIGTAVVQHDMDTTAIGDPPGLISGINKVYFECCETCAGLLESIAQKNGIHTKKGVMASGDCFVHGAQRRADIISNFSAITCEMESGAIGQVCYVNDVPFAVLRTVSDSGDENSDTDYAQSLEKASNVGIAITKQFLKAL